MTLEGESSGEERQVVDVQTTLHWSGLWQGKYARLGLIVVISYCQRLPRKKTVHEHPVGGQHSHQGRKNGQIGL